MAFDIQDIRQSWKESTKRVNPRNITVEDTVNQKGITRKQGNGLSPEEASATYNRISGRRIYVRK